MVPTCIYQFWNKVLLPESKHCPLRKRSTTAFRACFVITDDWVLLQALNRAAEKRERREPYDLRDILEGVRQEEAQRQADMDKFMAEHQEYVWRQDEKVPMEHLEKVARAFNEYLKKTGKAR
jgi:hypothetical protein